MFDFVHNYKFNFLDTYGLSWYHNTGPINIHKHSFDNGKIGFLCNIYELFTVVSFLQSTKSASHANKENNPKINTKPKIFKRQFLYPMLQQQHIFLRPTF